MLFLDYDGTLVPFASRPEYAVPPPELSTILGALAADSKNGVMLVSGRSRADLERWFAGVPRLWLAAEHGALLRPPGSQGWQSPHHGSGREWVPQVRPVLEDFAGRTPGSFIEEKQYALVWHYRMCAPPLGEARAIELIATLDQTLSESELHAVRGHKTVEIKPRWVNKGIVVNLLRKSLGPADFQFAVGDDTTDEDLFAALDADSWTVRVGKGPSQARFSLPDPARVLELLEQMRNAAKADLRPGL